MKFGLNKKIGTLITVAVVALLVFLPFLLGTKTYPIAIVQGNSMYPNLQNGDLVLFKQANPQFIANGTVIVFVQSDTGVTMLDTLNKPTVIHRIVGSAVQGDGQVIYTTKGDNNKVDDPSVVAADHVLGTPLIVVPKLGILMLFLTSASGLVATIGCITIFYLGSYESKIKDDKLKETFLGELALMTVNGELSEEVFRKFEFAVKYANCAETQKITDSMTLDILGWLKKDALKKGWKIKKTVCATCSGTANTFESNKNLLTTCECQDFHILQPSA
jgi:signal peptidase I